MKKLATQDLIGACADDSFESGITIRTEHEPLAGPGTPVKPAVYAGGVYQLDKRWVDGQVTDVVSLDNVPSQANRLEAALESVREKLGLPEIVLDLSGVPELPPHLPRKISSFRFPHRSADAYLRDSLIEGQALLKTAIGKAIFSATADDAEALYEWFPQALLFGYWQAHLGTKRSQAKLARSWVSELVGVDPATTETHVAGLKGDPLNLNVDEAIGFEEEDLTEWRSAADVAAGEGSQKGGKKGRGKLSGIGHGQVPFGGAGGDSGARAAVSFRSIRQQATVSFASLRRISTGNPQADAPGRAMLTAIGIAAHTLAFGRAFSLRSGCDLRPRRDSTIWTWRGADEDAQLAVPDFEAARSLVLGCAAAAEEAGLPVGSRWPKPLMVSPNPALAKAIRDTWPLEA